MKIDIHKAKDIILNDLEFHDKEDKNCLVQVCNELEALRELEKTSQTFIKDIINSTYLVNGDLYRAWKKAKANLDAVLKGIKD